LRVALFAGCVALAGASPAWAGALTLGGGWQQEREHDTDLPASGYGANLSIDLGEYFFFGVNYSSLRTDPFEDATDGTVGRLEYRSGGPELGVVWPWTGALGVTAVGGYAESSTRGLDGFEHDRVARFDGATGSLTLWYQATSRLAFNAGRGYSYIGAEPGWDTSAGLGLRLWRELWLDGGYWRGEAADGWTAGLRAVFTDD
jgi:hypothetical protein